MEHVMLAVPDEPRVFRLAYASRATPEIARSSVSTIVNEAVESNRRNHVSGVLFSGNGIFLQWLEGKADDVCGLMSRISVDPRHSQVTVLSAGWTKARRFPRWPMQLADDPAPQGLINAPLGVAPCDVDHAMIAFDRAAERHRVQGPDAGAGTVTIARFADSLMTCDAAALPDLPWTAQTDLRTRARVVDEVCAAFADGWQSNTRSSADIAIGLAHLNCLWQRAGRTSRPIKTRHRVAIVVPPGSSEILGAIVKADLLRAAGMPVCIVMEPDAEASFAALGRSAPTSIIVTGPRVGLTGEAARAVAFAERVQARFPDLPVHIGGRASGPLCDWPERIGFARDTTNALPARDVEWLALKSMAILSSARK